MSIITAGTKHPPEDRYQVWIRGRIRGITGNHVDISGWFTVFDLKGAYDIIIGKNWHSKTRHLGDSDNVLHLLDADWSLLTDGRPAFVPKLALKGLRPHQGRYREMHTHCTAVARASSINLVTADEASRILRRSRNHPEEQIFLSISARSRWETNSTLGERFSPILESGVCRYVRTSKTYFNHQRAFRHPGKTTSASSQTQPQKYRTVNHIG